MIKKINIKGYRGFGADSKDILFAMPNGTPFSGLTILVGENNSGKSTILESLKLFASKQKNVSFSESKRNAKNKYRIKILCKNESDQENKLETIKDGGSEAKKEIQFNTDIIYIPSRRGFQKNFSNSKWTIETLKQSSVNRAERQNVYNEFTNLLKNLLDNNEFEQLLNKVISFPKWTIDLNESNQYYLKVFKDNTYHNSEGLGEGLISILTLVGTLFLSKPNSTVLIDEPELSLHPDVIEKLLEVFKEYSKDRQIIISTHSPFMIDLNSIVNGAKFIRVVNEEKGINTYELDNDSINFFKSVLKCYTFPHATGLDTKTIFFKSDNIIIVEGQEDVIGYKKIIKEKGLGKFNFYGWGAGGSGNIEKVVKMLNNLGFKKIVAIYDGDKQKEYEKLKSDFPKFKILILPTNDIRDKYDEFNHLIKEGILDKDFKIKDGDEYISNFIKMFTDINNYFYK